MSSGKYYWEIVIDAAGSSNHNIIGVVKLNTDLSLYPGQSSATYGYNGYDGKKFNSWSGVVFGDTFTTGAVIGVALDLVNGKIWFSKNNVWQNSGDPANNTNEAFSGLTGSFAAAAGAYNTTRKVTLHSSPMDLVYAAPSGFNNNIDAGNPTNGVKSVVFDIADSWLGTTATMVRAIEFKNAGVLCRSHPTTSNWGLSEWELWQALTGVPTAYFNNSSPINLIKKYGKQQLLSSTITISGTEPSYVYDSTSYLSPGYKIGSTISGTASGEEVNTLLSTVSGTDYTWYIEATTSGNTDRSPDYNFYVRYMCSGICYTNSTPASNVKVIAYRRSSGELVGQVHFLQWGGQSVNLQDNT